jgi:hypothetical protein
LVADEGDDWYSLGRYINRTTGVKLSFGTLTKLIGSMYKGNPIRNIKGHFLYFRDIKKIAGSEVSNGLNHGIQSVYEGHRGFGNFLFGWIPGIDNRINSKNSGSVKTNDPYSDSHPEDGEYDPFVGNTNPNISDKKYDDGGGDNYSGYGGPLLPSGEDSEDNPVVSKDTSVTIRKYGQDRWENRTHISKGSLKKLKKDYQIQPY